MLLWLSLLACTDPIAEVGLLGTGPMEVFPTAHHLDADGHVALEPEWLPTVDTPWDTERLAFREGFSVAQTAILRDEHLKAEAILGPADIGTDGPVWMVDLDDGRLIPAFAEVDVQDDQVLLVRPMETLVDGHQIAVVLSTQAIPRLDAFTQILEGQRFQGWAEHYQALLSRSSSLTGLSEDEIGLVFDFPVDAGTEPMDHAVASTHPAGDWTWLDEDTTNLPEGTYKQLTGTFTVDNWLVDDLRMELDGEGTPQAQGTAQAHLFVHIPESVRGAEPGTVPVLIFGHGLLQSPEGFLADKDDSSNFVELFDRMGVIVIASEWRGLCRDDLADVVWVANDMGRLPEVTDRLTQAVANNLALMELIQDGALLDDPAFEGLADGDTLLYYGVSLGGIMGAVTLAQTERVDHGVLHVGGGAWSLTFPRSANWEDFEGLVEEGVPASRDRQLLYAAMQLYWDPVDSMSYAGALSDRSLLLQMSVEDDEVTNLGTTMLAHSAGWSALNVPVGDLPIVEAPTSAPVLAPFDAELGDPEQGNQPALRTGAHREPRMWEAAKLQSISFLVEEPGVVEHYCVDAVCTPLDR